MVQSFHTLPMFTLMKQLSFHYASLCRCLMSSAGNFMKNMYVKRTPEMSKAIHIYSSALKATLTWQNMITLQVLLSVKSAIIMFLSSSHNFSLDFLINILGMS